MNFTLSDGTVVSLSELQTMIIEAAQSRNAKEEVCSPASRKQNSN